MNPAAGWTKFASGAVVVTLIAAIFWGGAAYQRFGGMEVHLISIDQQLTRIADVQIELIRVQDAARDQERRLTKLEESVKQLR